MRDGLRVAAVNDLSGFGRCSLTVAMPILSAMGCQVCPLPTALLSAHTGYEGAQIRDFTADMGAFLQHWKQLGLSFDAVYTGFLGDAAQVDVLVPFVQAHRDKGALCVIDPAMADHGRLYASCMPELVLAMRRLVALAGVTTPNVTEACLLTDTPYDAVVDADGFVNGKRLQTVGEQLLSLGCEAAVVTGVHVDDVTVENWVFVSNMKPQVVRSAQVKIPYAGTGDVFSSVLCGELLRGRSLLDAVEYTADFVHEVTEATAQAGLPSQDGIRFEPFLGRLMPENT